MSAGPACEYLRRGIPEYARPSALPQSFVILAGRLEAVDCAQSELAQATLRRYPVRADRPTGRKLLDIHGPRGDGRPAPPPAESRSSLAYLSTGALTLGPP